MSGPGVAMSSLPAVPIVSPSIRKDILAGKDINWAALLFPLRERKHIQTDKREIKVGDEVIPLVQKKDKRLAHNLTCEQFIKAFNIY